MFKKFALFTFIFCAVAFVGAVGNAAAQTVSRVRFARGTSSTSIKGRIAGYKYVDYVVGVRRGQTLSFTLTTGGSAEAVLFTDTEQNVPDGDSVREYSDQTAYTGDYKIRVLMPRAFARRGAVSDYTLRISVR